jgi:hypothetical protein
MMKRAFLLLAVVMVSSIAARGQAPNIYITQSGATSGNCPAGSTLHNPAWFNTSANWGTGSGQIGPATVVHLCGTITTTLAIQGNGTSGNPWILFFEPGAKISHAFCGDDGGFGCLTLSNHSFFIVDGGTPCGQMSNIPGVPAVPCNGIIEATANGTGLANQSSMGNTQGCAVNITNSHDWIFRNITIQNIYVRIPNSGDHSGALSEGFLGFPPFTNIHIHHVILHDLHWGLATTQDGGNVVTNLEYDHFYSYNNDHAIGIGMGDSGGSGFLIHDFHIGSSQVWDLATTDNHHDGIHFYGGANGHTTGVNTGIKIWNGLFDGDWGFSNTANIFFEDAQNATIFNNLFFSSTGSFPLSNGVMNNGNGPSPSRSVKFYNNTILWTGTNPGSLTTMLFGSVDYRNNIVSTASTSNSGNLVGWGGTRSGTWDYNLYAANNPAIQLFDPTSSCCQWTYATWKANTGADTHSQAIVAPPAQINLATGMPNAGSLAIGKGTNLTSLGIPELDFDRNGNPRPNPGNWDIGAFNFGTALPVTRPSAPTGVTAVPH